ncbi:MAG: hypothetical protein V9E94_01385 [Microthrixaceae bacterium]
MLVGVRGTEVDALVERYLQELAGDGRRRAGRAGLGGARRRTCCIGARWPVVRTGLGGRRGSREPLRAAVWPLEETAAQAAALQQRPRRSLTQSSGQGPPGRAGQRGGG